MFLNHNGTPTSIAAAHSIESCADRIRGEVYRYFLGLEAGATHHEATAATGYRPDTVRPRCRELVRMGLLFDTGRTRRTPSGRQAIVWAVKGGGQ